MPYSLKIYFQLKKYLRNREGHLCGLLYYLHGFLQKQQADYRVFVIDQAYPPQGQPKDRFNKAKLLNGKETSNTINRHLMQSF
jgi:hypothetical protein